MRWAKPRSTGTRPAARTRLQHSQDNHRDPPGRQRPPPRPYPFETPSQQVGEVVQGVRGQRQAAPVVATGPAACRTAVRMRWYSADSADSATPGPRSGTSRTGRSATWTTGAPASVRSSARCSLIRCDTRSATAGSSPSVRTSDSCLTCCSPCPATSRRRSFRGGGDARAFAYASRRTASQVQPPTGGVRHPNRAVSRPVTVVEGLSPVCLLVRLWPGRSTSALASVGVRSGCRPRSAPCSRQVDTPHPGPP